RQQRSVRHRRRAPRRQPQCQHLPGHARDSAWDDGIHNDEIATLNALIDGLATSLNTTGSRVIAVDLNTGFDPAVYTTDGQHPNPAGESFLADRWFNAMQPVLDAAPVNPGIASLESNSYTVNENAGTVTLAVRRINGTDGDITVFYNTVEGSAKPGTDYVAKTSSVVIPDGQSRATFTVSIVNNTTPETTETFNVSIDGVSGGASLGAPRTATVTINDDDAPATVGDGLRGDYFRRDDLTDFALTRIDPQINFAFGSGSPDPSIANNYFSARWTGQILPRHSQTYTFHATSDDGIRVWVNNALIINDWGPHVLRTATGTIGLQAGVRVNIRVEYREATGGAQAKLEWSSPSQAREVVPTSQLFSTGYTGNPGIPLNQQTLATGLNRPTTLKFMPNGNMLIGQQDGLVRTYRNGQLQTTPFIDLRSIVNFSGDRGLLSVAVHPQFPTQPYVYLLYTYDPPQTQSLTGPGGPDGTGNRGGRLLRVTADAATDYATAVPGSGVVILGTNSDWQHFGDPTLAPDINNQYGGYNPDGSYVRDSIPVDSQSHTIGDLAFLPDGSLLVTSGDGTAFGKTDLKAARVQDLDSLTGKLLRIDPITGQGLASNPYYNGDPDSNRSKVYAYGFRNPFRLTVDPDTGRIYVGDVGWNVWEEINLITPGANYGWPWYEGGEGTLAQTPNYRDTPQAQAFYASNPDVQTALIARNHQQGNIAIVAGDFIQGNAYGSQYDNAFVFSDFGTGDLELVTFNPSGGVASIDTASVFLSTPADLVLGPDGLLYITDLFGGTISRLVPA
ncbi:MAG: hypothetical protein HC834_03770, partial [Rhodospirillales bacterium]|nr:hypothetical protein [Rhodospirillales bacterium]